MPKKYRKKPVVVEAIQVKFGYTNLKEVEDFVGADFVNMLSGEIPYIKTLEGDMRVSDGDYIIKGVQGEFYPCKPEIFEETYEAVNVTKDENFKYALAAILNIFPDYFDKKEGSTLYDLFAPLAMVASSDKVPNITVNVNCARSEVDVNGIIDQFAEKLGEGLRKSL